MLSWITFQTPFWKRSWLHRLGRAVIYVVGAYLALLLLLMLAENHLLYLPSGPGEWVKPPAGVAVEDVWLDVAKTRVHGWWTPPQDWEPEDGAVLFCHGNGGNLSHRGRALLPWCQTMQQAVLLFDYPGYGQSTGSPSENRCYESAKVGYTWLVKEQKVPPERIILYGGSLGGGVATELATRKPHRVLVLVSPFTSIPDLAQKLYPFVPARWLVRNQFNNRDKIGSCSGPVFIAHSKQDQLIPLTMARELYEAAPKPKRFFTMDGWPHADTPHISFYPALKTFLADCEQADEQTRP